jgi:hypothetical protein
LEWSTKTAQTPQSRGKSLNTQIGFTNPWVMKLFTRFTLQDDMTGLQTKGVTGHRQGELGVLLN